jgi:hypothetical protein
MTRVRRLIRRHIAVLAVAALGAAVLAVPAGARTALEPGQPVPTSQHVNWRLAEASSPQAPDSQSVSLRLARDWRLAEASSPQAPTSQPVSLRLADAKSTPVTQTQQAVTPRSPVFGSSATPVAAPRSVSAPSDSDISGLAFILSLAGVAIVAAGGAAVVTSRVQRGGHSTA